MNKALMFMMGLLLASVANAATALLPGSISFDAPELWGKRIRFELDDNGGTTGEKHWYPGGLNEFSEIRQHIGEASGYLDVDSPEGIHRTVARLSSADGPGKDGGQPLVRDGIFIDTILTATPYRDFAVRKTSERDKLNCWIYRPEDESVTNFIITAGRMENGACIASNYVTTAKVLPGRQFRFVVRALPNVEFDEGVTGTAFEVYIDGVQVKCADGRTLFPSLMQQSTDVAAHDCLYSIGFTGCGLAERINFTAEDPQKNPDYDKVDLSVLRESIEFEVDDFETPFGEQLLGFPVLIRISEERVPGFHYSRTNVNGADLRFVDEKGQLLPSEVDTWNPEGESLVWVKLPIMKKGAKVTMHWAAKGEGNLPENDPKSVWSDYVAVWHMSEVSNGYAKDSTGNGFDVRGFKVAVAESSMIGTAVDMDWAEGEGDDMAIGNRFEEYLIGGNFTFTGWHIRHSFPSGQYYGNAARIAFGTATNYTDKSGWSGGLTWAKTDIRYQVSNGGSNYRSTASSGIETPDPNEYWFHSAFVGISNANYRAYFNGRGIMGGAGGTTINPNGAPLKLVTHGFCGDEIRLTTKIRSSAWIAAEYAQASNTNLIKAIGEAQPKGHDNYWVEEPSISKLSWCPEEAGLVVVSQGEPRFGPIVVEYFTAGGTPIESMPLTQVGAYKVVFTAGDGVLHDKISKTLSYVIFDERGYTAMGTDRTMLFNSDDTEGCSVELQGFWDIDDDYNLVWEHSREPWKQRGFVREGIRHVYYEAMTHRKLWEFRNARIGNLFQDDDGQEPGMNFLPWDNGHAMRFDDSEMRANRQRYAGTLILRNASLGGVDKSDPAAAYSPWYTNGIGTIYFDAVNAWCKYVNKLAVQISFDETNDVRAGVWTTVPATVFKVVGGKFVSEETAIATNEVVLAMGGEGGAVDNFYRVRVTLDRAEPMRFRIVRIDDQWGTAGEDGEGLVSIDNIVVSAPAMGVTAEQYGDKADPADPAFRGWKAPFDVPYPAVGDTVHARLKIDYLANGSNVVDSSFVAAAWMKGRSRYLNQSIGEWQDYLLEQEEGDIHTFVSKETIPTDETSDFEYSFTVSVNAPFYDYHDYTGLAGLGWPDMFTERRPDLILSASTAGKDGVPLYDDEELSPALGKDFFIRIREGESLVEGVKVSLAGAVRKQLPMDLIGPHLWRGMLCVTNMEGELQFSFLECNVQVAGSKTYGTNLVEYIPVKEIVLPASGEAKRGADYHPLRLDGASNYLEFRYNDESRGFSVGRAEYQNFNAWHDANRGENVFVGKYSTTSGVNVAEMVVTNAPMYRWTPLVTENTAWNENFELSSYIDPNYPKGVLLEDHKLPHSWWGYNGQFVDATLVANTPSAKTNLAGIAWQMEGNGRGSAQWKQNGPAGLDTVSFQARLAQSMKFENYSVWNGDLANSTNNYTFFIPALMSANNGSDLAPGATMSIVGYYRQHEGAYEFRIERLGNNGLQFSIYKWMENAFGQLTSACMGTKWFSSAAMQNNEKFNKPNMYGMFISLSNNDPSFPRATTIIAGLSENAANPLGNAYSGKSFRAICCVDDGSVLDEDGNPTAPYTCGSFGVQTGNCTGLFLTPQHYDSPIAFANMPETGKGSSDYPLYKRYTDKAAIKFVGTLTDDSPKFFTHEWDFVRGGIECYTNVLYTTAYPIYGLRTPTNAYQTVDVFVRKADLSDDWTCKTNFVVHGYGFSEYAIQVRTTDDSYVKIQAGRGLNDVTVWDIRQTAWRAEDMVSSSASDFYFTQCYVFDMPRGDTTNRYAKFQPGRALAEYPVSIRTPVMKGLGMIGFSYRDLRPGCEIWVQMATNNVTANLSRYNQSIQEGEGVGQWKTIQKYRYEDLVGSTSKSVYIGLHDNERSPVRGIMRIVINPDVVASAKTAPDPEFGSITITDVWAHDEPEVDTKSWWGWNMRTVGDDMDREGRMYLPDGRIVATAGNPGYGLSGALNNSLTAGTVGDTSEYDKHNPFIQSPTFGYYTNAANAEVKTGIGVVRFQARLYNNGDLTPAHVAIYGSVDGAHDDWGVALTNLEITSTHFRQYEYKVPGRAKFSAVRLVVDGVTNDYSSAVSPQRVILDEIVVSEKAEAAIGFFYARPFRTGLTADEVITDILSPDQQPLCDESWGIQTQIKLSAVGGEIDTNRGFRVTMRYFVGDSPWGYANWAEHEDASKEVDLKLVGNPADLIFRSTVDDPDTVVKPEGKPSQVVQYMVTVYYYPVGEAEPLDQTIELSDVEGNGWTNPTWYRPIDLNEARSSYSPYTILDTVSPGRAWINEVNFNDGTAQDPGNEGREPYTNQFIEIAVPWGVDLSGWKVVVTDMDYHQYTVATLGRGKVPGSKMSEHKSGDYDFLVIASEKSKTGGGVIDEDGQQAIDGTWTAAKPSYDFDGQFYFNMPYQISLYRPSGILEHQFVIQGTNTITKSYRYQYEGTNLVMELDARQPETPRFFVGQENSRKDDGVTWSSMGVTGSAHGEEGGWNNNMKFTPGRLNEGQDELVDWYLRPNGTNVWVYARVAGDHLRQTIGTDTSRDTLVIVPAGGSTNIVYSFTRPWYQIDSQTVNGVTNEMATGRKGVWTFELTNVTETVRIVATEGISSDLLDAGLDPADPYTPAVLNWLDAGLADGQPFENPEGPITGFKFKGLSESATVHDLSVKHMYWFDIDPTATSNWWLRAGISDYRGWQLYRRRDRGSGNIMHYTNHLIQAKMYISNEWVAADAPYDKEPFAPKRLQGYAGEKSDDPTTYPNGWTSVNFKVEIELQNGKEHNVGFLPFRWFMFGPGSFYSEDTVESISISKSKMLEIVCPKFTTLIEILDPFALSSPGYSYGWTPYRGYPLWFRVNLNSMVQPATIEMLKARSDYDPAHYEPDDP